MVPKPQKCKELHQRCEKKKDANFLKSSFGFNHFHFTRIFGVRDQCLELLLQIAI